MNNQLTPEEFNELKQFITTLGAYLPENKAPYVWDMYNRLNKTNEPRPCTCSSAGAHWKRAVDFLFNYVNK